MGEMIEIEREDGDKLPAYSVHVGDDRAGVVVIQEWWGLNEQIKKTGDRVAEAGFNAIVPDLYRGKLAKDADEANHMMGDLDFPNAVKDVAACLAHLKKGGHAGAVMGFCMGGALTLMSAAHLDNVDAGVCFYGIPPDDAADPKAITCRLQCHFAEKDDWCTPNAVDTLEELLKDGKSEFTIHRYAGVQHAFMNEARPEVHDKDAAQLAWDRSMSFLFGSIT
jgi:carboxymethylenebutenolidase